MDFLFEALSEIIIEPMVEGYLLAMMRFTDKKKNINKDKIKVFVVLESVILFLMFVVGAIMLAETQGNSISGKIILIASIAVSVVQVTLGIVLKPSKKKSNKFVKIMNAEQLSDLIDRMCNEDRGNSDSVSWKAYREAEKLSDISLFPHLKEYITVNPRENKEDKNKRKAVYFVIGSIIKNCFDDSACKFLIERLSIETDKYILSGIMDFLVYVNIPWHIDVDPIIHHSKSDKWLIRHSAIHCLGSSNTVKSKDALYYYLNQKDENNFRYEIIYANAALGKIGTDKDIPVLEQHINSRIANIRDSAECAIESIRSRNNLL